MLSVRKTDAPMTLQVETEDKKEDILQSPFADKTMCTEQRSVTGGGGRGIPMAQHLLKCFIPLPSKAICELPCLFCIWDAPTLHFGPGGFTHSVGFDH